MGKPAGREVGELLNRRVELEHFSEGDDGGVGLEDVQVIEKLPRSVIEVVGNEK